MISILLQYAAENFPARLRGRATGWIAGCSKVGGVLAQGLAIMALVPAFGLTATLIAIRPPYLCYSSLHLDTRRVALIYANWKQASVPGNPTAAHNYGLVVSMSRAALLLGDVFQSYVCTRL